MARRKTKGDVPLEKVIRKGCVELLRISGVELYSNINEGKRSSWGGKELQLQGMQKGVPDICIVFSKEIIYIEFKREGETPKNEQAWFHHKLRALGHKVLVWYSVDDAIVFIHENKEKIDLTRQIINNVSMEETK